MTNDKAEKTLTEQLRLENAKCCEHCGGSGLKESSNQLGGASLGLPELPEGITNGAELTAACMAPGPGREFVGVNRRLRAVLQSLKSRDLYSVAPVDWSFGEIEDDEQELTIGFTSDGGLWTERQWEVRVSFWLPAKESVERGDLARLTRGQSWFVWKVDTTGKDPEENPGWHTYSYSRSMQGGGHPDAGDVRPAEELWGEAFAAALWECYTHAKILWDLFTA